jgi:hypothetical protein
MYFSQNGRSVPELKFRAVCPRKMCEASWFLPLLKKSEDRLKRPAHAEGNLRLAAKLPEDIAFTGGKMRACNPFKQNLFKEKPL